MQVHRVCVHPSASIKLILCHQEPSLLLPSHSSNTLADGDGPGIYLSCLPNAGCCLKCVGCDIFGLLPGGKRGGTHNVGMRNFSSCPFCETLWSLRQSDEVVHVERRETQGNQTVSHSKEECVVHGSILGVGSRDSCFAVP
mmetsp:Transcript_25660/g.39372  ORF Transcript_25660/g.39372 Transcript_25660/m.39372 type:complete len:141 (-) Transcript_25660:72-494(-)